MSVLQKIWLAVDNTDFVPRISRSAREREMSGEESMVLWYSILAALIALLAYIFGRKLYFRLSDRLKVRRLFTKLAEAHRLDTAERELLLRIAAAANLDNPAILFLRPSLAKRHYAKLYELEGTGLSHSSAPEAFESLSQKLWSA